MSIRLTLLISYLVISLASASLITLLVFVHIHKVLRLEIENKLETQAVHIMQQIDTALFERMQNMSIWRHLDVMQEVRTHDVDKRLSQFLNEIQSGYDGTYQQLLVSNNENHIIAANIAALVSTQMPTLTPWVSAQLEHNQFTFYSIKKDSLSLSVEIPDAFQSGQIGRLYARFNWPLFFQSFLPKSTTNKPFYALLIDQNGRIIAKSTELHNTTLLFKNLSEDWLKPNDTGALNIQADFIGDYEMLVGYAKSKGHKTFQGLNWRVLVLQDSKLAFSPIWEIWHVFILFFLITLVLGALVAFWMSVRISNPIVRLAKYTRTFMKGKSVTLPPVNGSLEINELNTQFTNMINNLEQSRQDMVRVAKLAVIGEMAASMAHEVRTPLGILRSSAQMLQRDTSLNEIAREMTGYIVSETSRLNDLITTLLECARPRPPAFSQHNIKDLIEHSQELLKSKAEEKNILIQCQSEDQDIMLYCDRDQMLQVFLNLLINAIQHVNQQGQVKVNIRQDEESVFISVCDNGPGISIEARDKVFDPFYTRREQGIGLGLTVVQQIIIAHHGSIIIDDSPMGGCCFKIKIPKMENIDA